ncbi:MAG: glutaredoxin [Spirochaetales bacterium]|nr:glutaredoxin [Spirochaetales bacterium]
MNFRIIGTNKSNETKKIIRFFKERNISFQFVDIGSGDLNSGELGKIFASLGADNLLDEDSKAYQKKGLKYMDFDAQEEISENLELLRIPILRAGDKFYCQPDQDFLNEIIQK